MSLDRPPFGLLDRMDEGINELSCSCGERLWPDCDMSAASIVETFQDHLFTSHGITEEQIARWLESA